jgi:D-amino-acid dehydrogenase
MRIAVLGAGVIGVTTAYYLAKAGYEVEVVDADEHVSSAASSANAGLIAPADSTVWCSPETPKLLGAAILSQRQPFIRVRPSAGAQIIPWGLRFLRECSKQRFRENVAAAHALSAYSYGELQHVAAGQLDFDHAWNGMILLHRTRSGLSAGLAARSTLADLGESYETLTADELVTRDPGFRQASREVAGAIYARHAGRGDCPAFCRQLSRLCQELGATFSLGEHIEQLETHGERVTAVRTTTGVVTADSYVLALGAATRRIARRLGLLLPIMASRGYALTVPIRDKPGVPEVGGVDEDSHVAFSRMGNFMRVTSIAEFAGQDTKPDAASFGVVESAGRRLFGDALDWRFAEKRTGLRPVTPRGLPLIGPTPWRNLYVNTGHGHLGWTQACGSARLLADLIAGREPEINPSPYLPALRRLAKPARTSLRRP